MAKHKIVHKKHASKKVLYRNIAIAGIIVIAILAFYLSKPRGVAATVNGENIYEKRIDSLYNSLPPGTGLTKSDILQKSIDLKLLVQYIRSKGNGITEEVFQNELDKQLKAAGKTIDDLNQEFSVSGATIDDLKGTIEIEAFVKGVIVKNIKITDQEIIDYRAASNTNSTDSEIRQALTDAKKNKVISNLISSLRKSAKIVIYNDY